MLGADLEQLGAPAIPLFASRSAGSTTVPIHLRQPLLSELHRTIAEVITHLPIVHMERFYNTELSICLCPSQIDYEHWDGLSRDLAAHIAQESML